MNFEHLIYEQKERVTWITLNRPERYNSFGGMMRQELVDALKNAANDELSRVVVMTRNSFPEKQKRFPEQYRQNATPCAKRS